MHPNLVPQRRSYASPLGWVSRQQPRDDLFHALATDADGPLVVPLGDRHDPFPPLRFLIVCSCRGHAVERQLPRDQRKEDDADGPRVGVPPVVRIAHDDLGGGEGFRPAPRLQHRRCRVDEPSQTKICQLDQGGGQLVDRDLGGWIRLVHERERVDREHDVWCGQVDISIAFQRRPDD